MTSRATKDFWKRFDKLPGNIQELARKNYQLWLGNTRHPSLHYKRISDDQWSVRVGTHYRAAGFWLGDNTFVWTWIGTHAEYDKF
jgi:hypothetical protein